MPQLGTLGQDVGDDVAELAVGDDGGQLRVVVEVGEFRVDVAEVDVDRDGADLEAPEQRFDELEAVARVQADVIPGADTLLREVVRDPVRSSVELGERP